RNHSRIRWSVNKAAKLGVQVRTAEDEHDLRAWYQLYLETMRWNTVPPRSYRFFEALWRELHAVGLIRLLLAGQRVAGQTLSTAAQDDGAMRSNGLLMPLARAIWPRLPLLVTGKLGDWVYAWL